MKDAGFLEEEIKCKSRAKEFAVRRALKVLKDEKTLSINQPVHEVVTDNKSPISPISEVASASSYNSSSTLNNTVVTKPEKIIPGIKVVRRTPHQVHALAQNAFLLRRLRDTAIKEATTTWVEALQAKKNGEPHTMKKDIIKKINNKPQYKGVVEVHERTVRRLVSDGFVGVTPPRRGNPGSIPEGAYNALKDALISFISIQQASGKQELSRSELSSIVNDVVNSNPDQSRRGDKLMKRLQRNFGPELSIGKSQKMEEHRIKWTTYQNLKNWGDSAKEILIELGFGRQSTVQDNVEGEIYFYNGQLDRILNFDETRITLDQTNVEKGGRPSFIFYNPNKPRPGSSANKSSLSLTLIVEGTAAGEMIPPHFQLTTDGQNEQLQVWNTSNMKYMHDVHGKFGSDIAKYHPCTFGMNERGGMNTNEFELYVKNSLVTLYPDAADLPGRRVLLKADSGPGRKNTELMPYLRVRGFYFIPGLPNSTHVTQEMELLIGEMKSSFYENLEKLTRGRLMRGLSVPSGAEIVGLLLFGGIFFHDEHCIDVEHFINAFQVAGCKEKMRSYFEKIGFVPFSRNYLKNKRVRHDSAEDPMAEEYDALEYQNSTACGFLHAFGYNGSLLLSKIDRRQLSITEHQTLTRPAIFDKAKALIGAVTHGQQFKVTGGHHLTSNDFFIADALGKLEKEQRAMTAERKARQKQKLQYESALPLLEKAESSLLAKDLDVLLRYKLGELPGNLKSKADKLKRWREVKDQQILALEPWTNDDEERYKSLMEKQITLQDTALGRQQEMFKRQLISGMATMSLDERREMRKIIDDLDVDA
jgi:hypothetical protein